MRSTLLAVSLLTLAIAGCKRTDTTPKPSDDAAAKPAMKQAAATPSVAANDNLNAVVWVQTSAEYKAVSETIYRAAADKLDAALQEKTGTRWCPANAATRRPV